MADQLPRAVVLARLGQRACANCLVPLEKVQGAWVHNWFYTGRCANATPVHPEGFGDSNVRR